MSHGKALSRHSCFSKFHRRLGSSLRHTRGATNASSSGFHDLDYQEVRLDDPHEMVQATRKWSVTLREVDGTKRFVKSSVLPVKEEEFPEIREALAEGTLHGGQSAVQAYGAAS